MSGLYKNNPCFFWMLFFTIRVPKANTFKPVSKIVCRPFTASVSFGVRPVRLNLLPCKMILHTILRPCGMKCFRGSDFQGRQVSCTERTAIADNAENRFIWKISCVLKVFALGIRSIQNGMEE